MHNHIDRCGLAHVIPFQDQIWRRTGVGTQQRAPIEDILARADLRGRPRRRPRRSLAWRWHRYRGVVAPDHREISRLLTVDTQRAIGLRTDDLRINVLTHIATDDPDLPGAYG